MAQRRLLNKKISVSEQVAGLSIEAQLIFTWSIPHADDIGLLPFSPMKFKAMVTPMLDISIEKYGFHLESICQAGLMMPFIYENEKFYLLCSFFREQTLKKDRQPQTIAKIPLNRDKKKSWQTCEKIIGNHLETFGIQMEAEENGMEWNGIEENIKPNKKIDQKTEKTNNKQPDELWQEMILPFQGKYAPSLFAAFEDKWRQRMKNGKELWQGEKAFDISRRLSTWKRNEEKWAYERQQKQQRNEPEKGRQKQDGIRSSLTPISQILAGSGI